MSSDNNERIEKLAIEVVNKYIDMHREFFAGEKPIDFAKSYTALFFEVMREISKKSDEIGRPKSNGLK